MLVGSSTTQDGRMLELSKRCQHSISSGASVSLRQLCPDIGAACVFSSVDLRPLSVSDRGELSRGSGEEGEGSIGAHKRYAGADAAEVSTVLGLGGKIALKFALWFCARQTSAIGLQGRRTGQRCPRAKKRQIPRKNAASKKQHVVLRGSRVSPYQHSPCFEEKSWGAGRT